MKETSKDSESNKAENIISKTILSFISQIPTTDESESLNPMNRARSIANNSALKASIISGSLALPPGPAGLLTIIPDLIAVWKIQSKMVADIAGAFGKKQYMTQEQMMYCLFKHTASQAVRDLVVRAGQRMIIKKATLRAFQSIARKVGIKVSQRLLAKAFSRWLPVIGVLGVAAYAYYDTGKVAKTTIDLFQKPLDIEGTELVS